MLPEPARSTDVRHLSSAAPVGPFPCATSGCVGRIPNRGGGRSYCDRCRQKRKAAASQKQNEARAARQRALVAGMRALSAWLDSDNDKMYHAAKMIAARDCADAALADYLENGGTLD